MNINWIQKLKIALASLALLGLTACGGAGGGGGGIPASASQTISATMQAGTIAVNNTEVGGVMTVSTDNIGQHVLTVQNAGNKLLNAQIGQVMVFEGSSAMPLGFAGIVQSVQTTNVNGIPTTTATFAPANIANVFQNLNLNMSNITPNPQVMAGVALQNGVRTYTRTEPQTGNTIQNGLLDFTPTIKQTNATVGVDFSNGIKLSLWKVNGQWVDTDPNKPVPKVVVTYTGQIELQNPSFSQVNVVIENGKLVTHNLKLKGTLKRNIKVAVTGNAQITAAELGGWFGKGSPYYKNGTYNEIGFDYKGSTIKVRGIEKDPSKILIGAVILGVNGIIPTYGNSQTGNVLKTVPVGMVVKFFMSGDVTAEATASVGYQWRDVDINTGVGISYDDTLGLPVSLLTGNTKMPTPFWDAKAHLDQQEGVSYTVSGKASVTLTAGFDAGIVLTGLELAQASVEGGIRGSFSGQFDQPLGKALTGCYSSASVTAGVRSILDVAANVEIKTDFQNKWVTWMNTAVKTGFVYRFPMYPAEGVDYLAENTIWSAGDDTCHIPQFSATAGTAVYDYNFDAKATGYQPLVTDYTWDFGDGTTTSGVAATHTYSAAGSYSPKLTVLFSDGVQKTISQPIVVAAVPTLTPAFTTSFNGLKANFDATTSTPSANITSYLWNFGDGTTASGNVPSHLYAAYSNTPWSVTLTVTDSYGRTASTSQNVTATCPTGLVLQNGQCAIPAPSVTNVSPPVATLNTPTTLTVTGTNLPLTAVLSMADAVCQTPTNRTASGFTVSCTPQGTATGVKVITVKTDTLANGGTVIDAKWTVTVSATQPAIPTNGLVAYYPFDNDVHDASGNFNNGLPGGSVAFVSGIVGNGAKFNGIRSAGGGQAPDHVLVPNSTSLQFTNAMTISYWVRIDGNQSQTNAGCSGAAVTSIFGTVVAKSGDRNGFVLNEFDTGSSLQINPWSGGLGLNNGNTVLSSVYGTFRHVAYVVNGNTASQYINGVLVSSATGLVDFIQPNTRDLYIGASFNRGGACLDFWGQLDGVVDELRIYNRALSTQEIQGVFTFR